MGPSGPGTCRPSLVGPLVLVGRVLAQHDFSDSRLYDPDHVHLLRPKRRAG